MDKRLKRLLIGPPLLSPRSVWPPLVCILVVYVVLIVISINTGRSFLPELHRDVWLLAKHDPSGHWLISEFASHKPDGTDPPPPQDSESMLVAIQESSTGRTREGNVGQWRASDWFVRDVADSVHGWRGCIMKQCELDPALESALGVYVEQRLIPNSPPAGVWPNIPIKAHPDGRLSWHSYQTRMNWLAIGIQFALAIGVGAAAAIVLFAMSKARTVSTE